MYSIVWRRADRSIICVGLSQFATEAEANDWLRTLYCCRNANCVPTVERI